MRRAILKAVTIPGYQMPYSREMPMGRGFGSGLQITLSIIGPQSDDSVNDVTLLW